ncbi:MAG: SdrD B-like domain-containing protein [Anaerolineae bacterium]
MRSLKIALILMLVALSVGSFAHRAEATGPAQSDLAYRTYLPFVAVSTSAAKTHDTLTGIVWDDANGNGIQDPGENGLAGIAVALTATPLTNNDDPTSSMFAIRTDAQGAFQFKLYAGYSYTIQVLADAASYTPTTPTQRSFQTPTSFAPQFAFGLKPR